VRSAGYEPDAILIGGTFLGETRIIVTRGEDGEIHAMLNRCAHRGNLVCLKRRGHSENLTCVYHAWRYDLEGNLDSVAFRRGLAGKGECRRASASNSTG
jgi:anthranilate 1,2-dioxygenase large subunit